MPALYQIGKSIDGKTYLVFVENGENCRIPLLKDQLSELIAMLETYRATSVPMVL